MKIVLGKERETMRSILLTTAIFAFETFVKQKREENTENKEYLNGNIQITTYHNYGAFLNGGDKKPFVVKMLSILLTLGLTVLYILTFTRHGKKQLRVELALLLGGAYSNTYDRIKRGYVVDYLNFPKLPGRIKHIVFNISDFCIMIGACLIVIKQK